MHGHRERRAEEAKLDTFAVEVRITIAVPHRPWTAECIAAAPFPVGSRLLYVVLTRARHKILLLLFGDVLPPPVAPLANLTSSGPSALIACPAG